jgi:hypothetical protein
MLGYLTLTFPSPLPKVGMGGTGRGWMEYDMKGKCREGRGGSRRVGTCHPQPHRSTPAHLPCISSHLSPSSVHLKLFRVVEELSLTRMADPECSQMPHSYTNNPSSLFCEGETPLPLISISIMKKLLC